MARPKRVLMFLVDGFDPAYVQPARMPRLAALMKAGASTLDGTPPPVPAQSGHGPSTVRGWSTGLPGVGGMEIVASPVPPQPAHFDAAACGAGRTFSGGGGASAGSVGTGDPAGTAPPSRTPWS